MRRIVAWSLRQRVLVNLLFLAALGLGVVAYHRLPVDAWPDVNLDEAWITTVWDGAGAEDVERLVTRRIEEEIVDTVGVSRIVSTSQPGLSHIDVKFDEDLSPTELETAFSDLRDALNRVVGLPEDAEPPVLRRLTTSEVYPLFSVVVYDRAGDLPRLVLRETARNLKRVLSDVPGVQRVRFQGWPDREFRILVDRLRARRYGVGLVEVWDAVRREHRNAPAGEIEPPDPKAGGVAAGGGDRRRDEVRVRFSGEAAGLEELENLPLRVYPGREPLRLRDVAHVEEGFERVRQRTRFNGRPAFALHVAKTRDSDTLELREACWDAIQAFALSAPQGIGFEIVGDQSEVVRSRFRVLLENLFDGLILVALILFFALGLRNAAIALVGIPFSYLAALLVFPLFDLTVNNLTLFGLVLVGGMVVDDAIIVIENVHRHVERGLPIARAVLEGAREVAWPVTNACATTIAALLPLLLQGGVIGKFFSFIPKAVILALFFSVVECLTVLPVHYLDFGSRRKAGDDGPLVRMRRRFFGALVRLHRRVLAKILRYRVAFLTAVCGGSLLLVALVLHLPQDPWVSDFNAVFATIRCDPGYGLDQTAAAARLVEEELEVLRREGLFKNHYTVVGFRMTQDGIFIVRPDVAFFMGTLADDPKVTSNPERIVNRLRAALEERVLPRKDYRYLSIEVFTPHDGPPLGKPVAVRVESNDYKKAKRVAEALKAELRRLPGVYGVADNLDPGPREFRFLPDADRAAAFGLRAEDIAFALRAANDGLIAASYKDRRLDEDVAIRVLYAPENRRSPEDLLLTDIGGAGRPPVPLGEVCRVEVHRPNASFYHYDTRRTVLVTADVDGVVATGPQVNEHLARAFADYPRRYPGVRLVYGGEFEETKKSLAEQRRSFWIALVLIYMLLAAQFRSFRQPLVVMAVVPFGVLGVLLGLWVRGQPFTIPTMIAMIGLAGVVVNDSLVLVEFINLRRREGLSRLRAVLRASGQRVRPILLAAATTAGNLLPLAIGLGGTSRVWTPFAVSIVFGMAVASLMTLLMVPVLYTLVERDGRAGASGGQ